MDEAYIYGSRESRERERVVYVLEEQLDRRFEAALDEGVDLAQSLQGNRRQNVE